MDDYPQHLGPGLIPGRGFKEHGWVFGRAGHLLDGDRAALLWCTLRSSHAIGRPGGDVVTWTWNMHVFVFFCYMFLSFHTHFHPILLGFPWFSSLHLFTQVFLVFFLFICWPLQQKWQFYRPKTYWWNLVDRLMGNIFCTGYHKWTCLDFDFVHFVHFVQETGHQGRWMPTYLQRMSFQSQQSTTNWRSRPTSPETPGLSDAERDTNAEPAVSDFACWKVVGRLRGCIFHLSSLYFRGKENVSRPQVTRRQKV